ncbi:MAG TPA: hypothetical protein VF084_01065 [Nitrososphaeraceae archaeon]
MKALLGGFHFCTSSIVASYSFGSGFKSTNEHKYSQKERKWRNTSSIKTLIKVRSKLVWLFVAIEPETRQILALSISNERNMLIA